MSLPPFADPTLQVSWVLSRLDDILRIDELGRIGQTGSDPIIPINSHAETIRQAILSMRRDIAPDRALDVVVSNNSNPDIQKRVQTKRSVKLTTREMTPARLTGLFGLKTPSRRDLIRDGIKLHGCSGVYPVPTELGLNPPFSSLSCLHDR